METLIIRKERLNRGWTLSYVGSVIGISKQTVHDIETGRQNPSYKVLVKIEDLFCMGHRTLFSVAK